MVGAALVLGAAEDNVPDPYGLDYVTALDDYNLAWVSEMHGDLDQALAQVRSALAARDRAIAGYRDRASDPVIGERLRRLQTLDRPCCKQESLSQRITRKISQRDEAAAKP